MDRCEVNQDTIIIRSLTKHFSNGVIAVDNLDVSMYKGQIFALLGHNGAGKTTTVNMMIGMLKPTSGNAYLLGHDITTNMS